MRIEAIDRLLTLQVRQDILSRLNRLGERLNNKNSDINKLMMSTAIQSVFEEKDLPWGATNLIVEFFQRSLKITEAEAEEAVLYEQLESLLGEDLTEEELLKRADDPRFMQELEAKIDPTSDLYQQISSQADKISDAFVDAIWHGRIELDLFEEAELLSYLELIQKRLQAAGLEPSDADSLEVSKIVQATIVESIEEIVNPKRLRKFKKDLQAIFKIWLQTGNKFAGPLNTEIRYLDKEVPAENAFIRNLFLSQFKRTFGGDESEESEPGQKQKRRRRRRKKK